MTFKLRIPGDGHESISSCDQYSDASGPSWNKEKIPITKPKEFTITPNCGTIRSQGFAAIRVKCAHTPAAELSHGHWDYMPRVRGKGCLWFTWKRGPVGKQPAVVKETRRKYFGQKD